MAGTSSSSPKASLKDPQNDSSSPAELSPKPRNFKEYHRTGIYPCEDKMQHAERESLKTGLQAGLLKVRDVVASPASASWRLKAFRTRKRPAAFPTPHSACHPRQHVPRP